MALFKISDRKLEPVNEKKIDLENDIQKLTEKNLEAIFGIKFVSGSLNQELSVRTQEQEFYIDTLGFNESQKSLVIIEYKKEQSFSVIDQGFAYLSAMINNKAEFILELNKRLGKNFGKDDIDWEQSRVIFISTEFTNYQINAINFKDLPLFLYKVQLCDNNLIEFNAIKPYKTTESINKFSKDKTIAKVSKEVKVYSLDDLFKPDWSKSKELYQILRDKIIVEIGPKVSENITKQYIAFKLFKNGQWYNFTEIQPQESGLLIYLDIDIKDLPDHNKITTDCSEVGHWATGNTRFKISSGDQLEYAVFLIGETFNIIMGK